MAKVDPNDFLLNTDYEMDKLVLVKEGKLDAPQTISFPHNLPFRPLVFGLCSFKENFSSPSPSPFYKDPEFIGSPQPFIQYKVRFSAAVYGDDITVVYANSNNDPQPIYYRLYAFEPTDSYAKVPPTKNYATLFTLDTDRNYRKLYKKGLVEIGKSVTIKHDFGYIPQVMVWYDFPNFNKWTTNVFTFTDGSAEQVTATTSQVKISFPAQAGDIYNDAKIHYRIYYDEA